MKTTKIKTTKTKTAATKVHPTTTRTKKTTANSRVAEICTCENCLNNTQATRLNRDFKNAVLMVSLGVNLVLFTFIITAMVSEAYAQQLSVFFK